MATIPLFYFGNIAYWVELCKYKSVAFSGNHILPKRTYANRTIIMTANGEQTLSIPIEGGRGNKSNYIDIKIADDSWKKKHLTALKTAYSKSSYYEHYIVEISRVLMEDESSLFAMNLALFSVLKKMLHLELEYSVSHDVKAEHQAFDPKIKTKLLPYPQVFRERFEFQSDLSIIDLLFNLGPQSKMYLENNIKN